VPSLYVVDVSNTSGDTPEYKKNCDHHMIPTLQDIGWAWWRNDDEEQEEDDDKDDDAIGAGSSSDAKVSICEMSFATISSDNVGGVNGTCVLHGCVPKNLLVYASKFSHEFEESGGFGWSYECEPKLDWKLKYKKKCRN
jgi:hypothetical protein